MWLRLWCRLAGAAPNNPLAWELSYAVDVALKRERKKKRKKGRKEGREREGMTIVQE